MKIQHSCFISAIILAVGLFNAPAQAMPSVNQLESQFEFQLNTRLEPYGQPKATSYYDDLEDHYAQDQLMSDMIGEGI